MSQITNVRIRHVFGTIETEGEFWEDRLVMPLDVYEEFRVSKRRANVVTEQGQPNRMDHDAYFIQIETDDGAIGIGGPVEETVAYLVDKQLTPLLLNRDPMATEFLWDIMHRSQVHGRHGQAMMAISVVDCALWDLKGRSLNVPVYTLLGGPTRDKVPAYASMLGFNVTDMVLVRERAAWAKSLGYTAQKWFFRHGPMSGHDGFEANVAMVETLRDELGDGYDIMLDCWQAMDVNYVLKLAGAIEDCEPRWLEEVAMPDRIDSYRKIRERTNIPISGAEHEYTRWGFKRFIDAEALDILQPDIYWAGGISETLKIMALATAADLITIPHGHSSPSGIHVSVTQSPIHTPYQEFLIKWNRIHQHFLADPITPENGHIAIPTGPGIGMDLRKRNRVDKIGYILREEETELVEE